jgi:hypothetical protein
MVRNNPHARASLVAFRTSLRNGGHAAVYHRGDDSVDVCVIPGRQDQLNQGRSEASVSGSFANFEIEAAKLILDGEQIEPAAGDRLVVTFENGEEKEFAAVKGVNNRVWDWADNHHQIYTCHYSGRSS